MRVARVEKRQNLTALAALPENALAALGDVLIAIAAGAQQDVPAGKALVIENDDLIMPGDKAQQTKDTDDSGDGRQIGLLRQQLLPSAYVHGIIKEGGTAANTIPDLAVAEFYVRAETLTYLNEVRARVEEGARGGAAAAGARLEIEEFEAGNDNLVTNETLMDLLEENWRKVGIENIVPALPACGSSDIGNVSHVCPAIHPYYSIQASGEEIPTHTEEFREATLREPARKALQQNVCAMAMTGKDIMDHPQLLTDIKDEFKKAMEKA